MIFFPVDIIKVYVLSSTTSQYSSEFHSFFNKEKKSAETETKIDLISSIWYDDHIRRPDEKNRQCLWCNQSYQGINATKDLAHILGEKGMSIKSFYVSKEISHATIHQELQHYK